MLKQQATAEVPLVHDQSVQSVGGVAERIPANVEQPFEMLVPHLEQVFVEEPMPVVIGDIRWVDLMELVVAHRPPGGDSQGL
jgi:hypothetical protein